MHKMMQRFVFLWGGGGWVSECGGKDVGSGNVKKINQVFGFISLEFGGSIPIFLPLRRDQMGARHAVNCGFKQNILK